MGGPGLWGRLPPDGGEGPQQGGQPGRAQRGGERGLRAVPPQRGPRVDVSSAGAPERGLAPETVSTQPKPKPGGILTTPGWEGVESRSALEFTPRNMLFIGQAPECLGQSPKALLTMCPPWGRVWVSWGA